MQLLSKITALEYKYSLLVLMVLTAHIFLRGGAIANKVCHVEYLSSKKAGKIRTYF